MPLGSTRTCKNCSSDKDDIVSSMSCLEQVKSVQRRSVLKQFYNTMDE